MHSVLNCVAVRTRLYAYSQPFIDEELSPTKALTYHRIVQQTVLAVLLKRLLVAGIIIPQPYGRSALSNAAICPSVRLSVPCP